MMSVLTVGAGLGPPGNLLEKRAEQAPPLQVEDGMIESCCGVEAAGKDNSGNWFGLLQRVS